MKRCVAGTSPLAIGLSTSCMDEGFLSARDLTGAWIVKNEKRKLKNRIESMTIDLVLYLSNIQKPSISISIEAVYNWGTISMHISCIVLDNTKQLAGSNKSRLFTVIIILLFSFQLPFKFKIIFHEDEMCEKRHSVLHSFWPMRLCDSI